MTAFPWSRGEPATDWSALENFNRESTALLRLWRGFMTARCFVAVVLLLLQAVAYALGQPMQPAAIALTVGYIAVTSLAARFAPFRAPVRGFGAPWLSTIGVDLVTFTALQLMQIGSINYTPLFALPVLMGAVLGTGAVGLGTTAAVTLLLLGHAGWYWLQQPQTPPHASCKRRSPAPACSWWRCSRTNWRVGSLAKKRSRSATGSRRRCMRW
ncbi:MAG: hypothetical protein WKG52_11095 [Variovorax sp.]